MRDIAKIMASMDSSHALGDVYVDVEGPFITQMRMGQLETWLPFFESLLIKIHATRAGVPGRRPDWLSNFEVAVRQLRTAGLSTQDDQSPTPKLAALRRLAQVVLIELNTAFDECKAALATYWKRVRYLGPLRHQPQRFYQFDDTGGADIGVSGEFTVQVLSLEAYRMVRTNLLGGWANTARGRCFRR